MLFVLVAQSPENKKTQFDFLKIKFTDQFPEVKPKKKKIESWVWFSSQNHEILVGFLGDILWRKEEAKEVSFELSDLFWEWLIIKGQERNERDENGNSYERRRCYSLCRHRPETSNSFSSDFNSFISFSVLNIIIIFTKVNYILGQFRNAPLNNGANV